MYRNTHLQALERGLSSRKEVFIHEQVILPHIRSSNIEHHINEPRLVGSDSILDKCIDNLRNLVANEFLISKSIEDRQSKLAGR